MGMDGVSSRGETSRAQGAASFDGECLRGEVKIGCARGPAGAIESSVVHSRVRYQRARGCARGGGDIVTVNVRDVAVAAGR